MFGPDWDKEVGRTVKVLVFTGVILGACLATAVILTVQRLCR